MTEQNDNVELYTTVLDLRKKQFADIPEKIVIDILRAEESLLDDQIEASGRISEIVERYLTKKKSHADS